MTLRYVTLAGASAAEASKEQLEWRDVAKDSPYMLFYNIKQTQFNKKLKDDAQVRGVRRDFYAAAFGEAAATLDPPCAGGHCFFVQSAAAVQPRQQPS